MTSKTIQLSIAERIAVSRLLPVQGSRIEMKMCESLANALSFTEEEKERAEIRQEDGFFVWKKDFATEFVFTPEQLLLLQEGISQADKDRRITRDLLPVIDRFEANF